METLDGLAVCVFVYFQQTTPVTFLVFIPFPFYFFQGNEIFLWVLIFTFFNLHWYKGHWKP